VRAGVASVVVALGLGLVFGLGLTACSTIPTWVENAVICIVPCANASVRMTPIDDPTQTAAAMSVQARAAQAPCNPTGAPAVTFAELRDTVFEKRCGINGACHLADTSSEAKLDLAGPDTYDSLLEDAHGARRCDPKLGIEKRVVPGDPEHSMLWQVVAGSSCGPQMPFRSQPLNCDDQERVYAWIKNGAKE
jgi:hypothetical protein